MMMASRKYRTVEAPVTTAEHWDTLPFGRARLIRLREDLGFHGHGAQSAFCRTVGVGIVRYNGLEREREPPRSKSRRWQDAAATVANFHGVSPEAIWGPACEADIPSWGNPIVQFPAPDEMVGTIRVAAALDAALATLSPNLIKAFDMRMRMGETLTAIGEELGRGKERARQLYGESLKRLRADPGVVAATCDTPNNRRPTTKKLTPRERRALEFQLRVDALPRWLLPKPKPEKRKRAERPAPLARMSGPVKCGALDHYTLTNLVAVTLTGGAHVDFRHWHWLQHHTLAIEPNGRRYFDAFGMHPMDDGTRALAWNRGLYI